MHHDPTSVRNHLAAAYQLIALLGLDDLTYTHLTARVAGEQAYYIYPFGYLYEETSASCLLKVNLAGEILEGESGSLNITGLAIHGSTYAARPDINAIFHLHTPEIVAVSAHPQGLQPLSQWALHFYQRIAYYPYSSLVTDREHQSQDLVQYLGNLNVMLLQNHGSLCCGRTIPEAFFYQYHLQQACKTQVAMGMSSLNTYTVLSESLAEQSRKELLSFEKDLGERDWQAWLRKLQRIGNPHQPIKSR